MLSPYHFTHTSLFVCLFASISGKKENVRLEVNFIITDNIIITGISWLLNIIMKHKDERLSMVYMKVVKRVDSKSSHQKKKRPHFFFFFGSRWYGGC